MKTTFILRLLPFGFNLFFAGFLIAQDSLTTESNSLKEGMKALQFQIGNDLALVSYPVEAYSYPYSGYVGAAALKFQNSEKSGLRVAVAYSGLDQQNDGPQDSTNYSTLSEQRQSVEAYGDWMWYVHTRTRVHFYGGFGPTFSYTHRQNVEVSGDRTYGSYLKYKSTTASNIWEAGLNLFVGTEWFISKELSLSGEYRFRGTYVHA